MRKSGSTAWFVSLAPLVPAVVGNADGSDPEDGAVGNKLDFAGDAGRDGWGVYGAVMCVAVMEGAVSDNAVVRDPVDDGIVVDGIVMDVDGSVMVGTVSDVVIVDDLFLDGGVVNVAVGHGAVVGNAVDATAVFDDGVVDGAGRSISSAS